jgi:RNA polymerase sigma factor (sigma-70 family)
MKTCHQTPQTPLIFKLVDAARVRTIVLAMAGRRLQELELDEQDYLQEVYLRLLRADRSERSRYDPERGRSPSSYVYMVAFSVLSSHIKTARRAQRFIPVAPEKLPEEEQETAPVTSPMVERMLAALDLDIERQAALLLASGCTVKELAQQLELTMNEAREMRTRVRALLLPVKAEVARAL